jgi:nucleoside-diphosphate-sugar epimerase
MEGAGHTVLRAVRKAAGAGEFAVGNIDSTTVWSGALACGVDVVVHLAARVHVMREEDGDIVGRYHETNVQGTENLARQSAEQGVRRFVYLSTVKVLGEGRASPYGPHDAPAPVGAYAESKWAAEQALTRIAERSAMGAVILRPPLVYGPGVGANFLGLLRAVDQGWPLPFASVANRRSLIYVGNLVDAIGVAASHPRAVGKTYLVSDGAGVSTPELIRCAARALGRQPRLLPVPVGLMRAAARLVGRGQQVDRLLGSLEVDSSAIRDELGWSPRYSIQDGLAATAAWYHRLGWE